MTNSLSTSSLYDPTPQDEVTAISEQDFLARVAAFERNEAQEAARAKESMKRMVAQQQTKSKIKRRQCHRDNDNIVDESDEDGHGRPPLFTSASPTAAGQPPPVNAIYPFYELAGRGPPPLQDAYRRDSLATNRQRHDPLSDPYYGFTPPPALIVKKSPYRHENSHLTRGGDYQSTIITGGYADGAGMQLCSSPDDPAFSLQLGYTHPSYRHHHSHSRQSNVDSQSRPVSHPHPRSNSRQAPLPVPPRIHSALAPPTSLHEAHFSTNDNHSRERGPTFRFDYDLRTNPATLRVSSRANGGGPFYVPPTTQSKTTPLNHVYTHPTGSTNHASAMPSNVSITNNNTTTKYHSQHQHHHHLNAPSIHVRRPLNDHLRKSAFSPPQQVKIPIRA